MKPNGGEKLKGNPKPKMKQHTCRVEPQHLPNLIRKRNDENFEIQLK
jgi:hypothetical protein